MATRIYFVPRTGSGTFTDMYRAAYVPVGAKHLSYGNEPWFLAWADVTPAQHSAIIANTDATAIPADLSDTVGAALTTVQAKLEAANIPSQWVTAGMTWRAVVKWTARLIQVMQRFHALDGFAARLFAQVTLDDPVSAIPQAARQRLTTAAQTLGLSTDGITLAMTVRAALIYLAQQWTSPFSMSGETF